MKLLEEIKAIWIYLLIIAFFIIVGLISIMVSTKSDIHLTINEIHNSFFDVFFKLFTHVGDGAITAIAILPLGLILWKKYRYSPMIIGWGTLLLCGVFAQFLKRVIYPNADRPLKFFGENVLYLVPDVDVHMANSFPSGHTTTAFGFFAFLAIYFGRKKPILQFVFAMSAVLVGYSRMYISQHFLEDVVMGATVGLAAFIIMLFIKTKLKVG